MDDLSPGLAGRPRERDTDRERERERVRERERERGVRREESGITPRSLSMALLTARRRGRREREKRGLSERPRHRFIAL